MDKIRTCNICGVTSDKAKFYAGVTSRCAECHKTKVRENRASKIDYYQAYDAHRFQNDPRVRERHKRYQKTEAGKAALKKAHQKWKSNNSDKRAAQVILGNAVRDGRIEKPRSCSSCGCEPDRLEGHHEDYSKPLDVIWLCRQCHANIHREGAR